MQRALLGILLLNANEVVSQDRLVDSLWGESPPPTAVTALHGYVSRLRRLLGDGRLRTQPPGYVLRVAPDELDVHRFKWLLDEERYAEALALWRGPPLADLAFESFAQGEIARLDELRLAALEGRFERALADGRHGELVGELQAAVRAHPLQERFAAQLMLALYRAGRQADALATYQAARARLVEELGLEPGDDLRRLQVRILEQDPALDGRPARRRTRLPASTTSFVGRLRELEQVRALLERPGVRLLTLTGPGGTGKTRLALEVARALEHDFAAGACFVPLAPLTDESLVAPAIAQALQLRQTQGQSIAGAIQAFLRTRELLLVLDNFEHLLAAAPLATELLAGAPGLTILATSRSFLNVYGENEYAVPPLGLEASEQPEAVALFVDRAAAVRTGFVPADTAAIGAICARLDGLPLAIELAAAQVRTLAPEAVLGRLERRLELLTGGPRDLDARQRTLRDTILWSHELLERDERRLFARLSVFAGGWTAAAARQVCGSADELGSLAQQSLIVRDGHRFSMLETIRELAAEQLAESGDEHEIRTGHARWSLALAEYGGPNRRGAERAAWLERIAAERENLLAALAWSAGPDGDVETGLRLASAMYPYWMARGLLAEGERFLAAVLERSREPTAGRVRTLAIAGILATLEGKLERSEPLCEESLRLARPGEEWYRAVALNALGTTVRLRGRIDEARRLYDEALDVCVRHDLWWPSGLVSGNLGAIAALIGRHDESAEHYERCVATARAGGDSWIAATGLVGMTRAVRMTGDEQRARALLAEALDEFVRADNAWGVAVCLDTFALLAADRGEHLRAARLYGAEEAVRERAGVAPWPTISAEHDEGVRLVESVLGESAWTGARAEGRAMSQDEAIAAALVP